MRLLALVFALSAVTAFANRDTSGLSRSHQPKITLRAAPKQTQKKAAVPKQRVVQSPRSHHRG